MNKKILFFLSAAVFFSMSGCGPKADNASVAVDAAKEAPALALSGAKSPDLSSAGSLKGKAAFTGQAEAPKEISVQGNPECAVLHPGGKIASEEVMVKDGGLKNVFIYVKEGLENYSF